MMDLNNMTKQELIENIIALKKATKTKTLDLEKLIKDERTKTEDIFTAIGEGISIQNRNFKVIYQNDTHKEITHGDHVGKYCYQAYDGRDDVCEGCPVEMAYADGEIHSVEWSREGGEGPKHVEITASPLHDANGEIVAGIEIVRDITPRIKSSAALRKSKEAAEEANRSKSEFLANMSHEVRTPMNGIIGMTNLVLDSELSSVQRKHLQMVKASSERLLSVINDILDFSKIEANRLTLESNVFNLRDTLDEALGLLSLRASIKKLSLTCKVTPEVPMYLIGDPGRVIQILINLVENAIKFTNKGGIEIRVNLDSTSNNQFIIHFSVKDTGIGIPLEKQKVIFNAFTQADGSYARQHGGTGLGLSISSRLVKIMGGEIWIENVTDPEGNCSNGSIFHFTASFAESLGVDQHEEKPTFQQADLDSHPLVNNHKMHVLLAEDEYINQVLAETLLEEQGWKVTTVSNGQSAIEAFDNNDFDLILMDVQMPVVDGFDATTIIRQKGEKGRTIPIIAITAHAIKGDKDKCLKSGMNDYMSKPVESKKLIEIIHKHIEKNSFKKNT